MKKLITLALVIILALSTSIALVACGDDKLTVPADYQLEIAVGDTTVKLDSAKLQTLPQQEITITSTKTLDDGVETTEYKVVGIKMEDIFGAVNLSLTDYVNLTLASGSFATTTSGIEGWYLILGGQSKVNDGEYQDLDSKDYPRAMSTASSENSSKKWVKELDKITANTTAE